MAMVTSILLATPPPHAAVKHFNEAHSTENDKPKPSLYLSCTRHEQPGGRWHIAGLVAGDKLHPGFGRG